jgi:serine/threonine-protein kinase
VDDVADARPIGTNAVNQIPSGPRQARLSALFDQAQRLDEAGREDLLAQLAREDAALGDALEQLLAADTLADVLGDALQMGVPEAQEPAALADDRIGTQVGAWTLTECLQADSVFRYRAVRTDEPAQQVVLHCLPAGSQTPMRVARFLRERRIAAGLVHPGLPLMVDQGLDARGRPWFALAHAEGEPLVAWCARRALALPQLLDLLLQACDAVAYAHGRAVLHQQLDQAHVVVAADGAVRVLGFGEAGLPRDGVLPSCAADTSALGRLMRTLLRQAAPEVVPGRLAGVVAAAEEGAYSSVEMLARDLRAAVAGAGERQMPPQLVEAPAVVPAAAAPRPARASRWGNVVLGVLMLAMAGEIGLLVMQGRALREQTAQAVARSDKAVEARDQAVAMARRSAAEVERVAAANAFDQRVFAASAQGASLRASLDGTVSALTQSPPADGLQHVRALLSAASAYGALGEGGAAIRTLQVAMAEQARGRGAAAQERAQVRAGLAEYTLASDPRQALAWANEAAALLRADATASAQVLASTYGVLARAQANLEDLNGAIASTRLQRQSLLDAGALPNAAAVVQSHVTESRLQAKLGHVEEALAAQELAISLRGPDSGLEAVDALLERNDYGALLLRAGRPEQALAQFQVARTGLAALRGPQDAATRQAALGLRQAQAALGERSEE